MADANTEVDLETLHDVIAATIKADFPALRTVEFYRGDRQKIEAPACLLEMPEMELADLDPGTSQLAVRARFEARVIIGFRTQRSEIEIRKLTASLAAYLHLKRWPDVVTGPGEVVSISRDEFDPELDQYEVWRIEWAHVLHLGETVWKGDGVIPTWVFAQHWDTETETVVEP
jgi:hypothetical protein